MWKTQSLLQFDVILMDVLLVSSQKYVTPLTV